MVKNFLNRLYKIPYRAGCRGENTPCYGRMAAVTIMLFQKKAKRPAPAT
jgi:hypothetical protein